MNQPKAILFDLDDTLALSFESPQPEMLAKLRSLLELVPIAIVTGRDFPWMARDFLGTFTSSTQVSRFYVLPEGAAQCFQWNGAEWTPRYTHELSPEEITAIEAAVRESVAESGVLEGVTAYGEQFRRKRAMVAFSTIGIDAPRELRYSWDPGNVRRSRLAAAVAEKLPQYDVVMGGATTIDITRKGINKAYGVRWLAEELDIAAGDMLFIGDALYEGGNDHVVVSTGITTRSTTGPDQTSQIIDELLAAYATPASQD